MAHRVHYVTRIDWTPRKLHSNAVFWHSLAPDKLEPPHSVPISLKIQYVPTDMRPLCSSQLGGFYGIYILILWIRVFRYRFACIRFNRYRFSRYTSFRIRFLNPHPKQYPFVWYHNIGMRNIPVSIIRYHLTGMQYIPISFTTYRLSNMQYISATFIMYHLTGMQVLVSTNGFR